MTDPDLQAAHEEAMRQLAIKFEGESRRILKQAIEEYDRAMHRALKVYAIIILALLIVIAVHIARTLSGAALPT